MTLPNPSTAQARALVDELSRHGVSYATISPGSRSAALAIAVDQHPGIESRVVLDERSAGFHALGRARVTGSPVVVVCTSGTAVANLLPAVVEADLSLVPLVVLSADRPSDLQGIGANQTIDQAGIFGSKVRWESRIPAADDTADWNGYWRSTVSQAVAMAMGHGGRPGPVHLNVAFREPTVPVTDDGRSSAGPYSHSIDGREGGAPWQAHHRAAPGGLSLDGISSDPGLIIAGEADYDRAGLAAVAGELGWPVLATAASAMRVDSVVTTYHHLLVSGVPRSLKPTIVVTVGRTGPSDRLGALTSLDTTQVQIEPWGSWIDPRRQSTHVIQADPVSVLADLRPSGEGLAAAWADADSRMRTALDERLDAEGRPTGPAVARALGDVDHEVTVAASSMPVRDIDAHMARIAAVVSNRGASGIDGFVSTAVGVASAGGRTLAMTGDLSLLHDAGSLRVEPPVDVVFVVIDNGGGGLFDLLPQAEHAPGYERLFVAPHGIDLVRLGEAYGVAATRVDDVGDVAGEATRLLGDGGVGLVVVPVDREEDLKLRRALDDVARAICADLS